MQFQYCFAYLIILTSASSRAVWISHFSVSTCFLDFSSSWMLFPVSPICSVRSEISSAEQFYIKSVMHIYLQTSAVYIIEQKLTLEVLVFTLQGLQLIQSFFIWVLHLEKLSAERTSLFLSSLKLWLALLIFLLPFSQNLKIMLIKWYIFGIWRRIIG